MEKRTYQTIKPLKIQTSTPIAPVTVSEYVRRKNAYNLKKDPLSNPISMMTVRKALEGGYMEAVESCGRFLIDWERFKDFPFRTNKKPSYLY